MIYKLRTDIYKSNFSNNNCNFKIKLNIKIEVTLKIEEEK
jgi:hypothetical protein